MLVLTRRLNQKIILPALNAAISVVSIKPHAVRIGIEAPDDVEVYREELLDRPPSAARPAPKATPRELKHAIRNRLNATTIGLALLRRQIELGQLVAAGETIDRLQREVAALGNQLEGPFDPSAPNPAASTAPKPRGARLVADVQPAVVRLGHRNTLAV
jgi:carbon storage regulator CsrA